MSILINRKLAARALAEGQPLASVAGRGVGKTTASILQALGTAINNPGTLVLPHDPDLGGHRAFEYRKRAALAWKAHAEEIVAALMLQDIEIVVSRDAVVSVRSTYTEVIA